MEIRKIYFDMDGVLADFDRGVREILGLKPIKQEHHTPASDDLLFGAMKEADHFYYRLHAVEGSLELFRELYDEFGRERIEILTGIPNPKRQIITAKEDKIRWVKNYLPADLVINAVLRKEKPSFCKGPGDILIDDFSKNIMEWEKAGGTGILFVTPDQVRAELKEIRSRM